ncbi:arsenate reductase family protein [Gracilibacillus alcaliphilus]|uniref:arsenate reductase family protein n=1 Tax=Gracilibacillus alcaliphilus TaxID=1401441 RepID=UPI00195E5456|nr:arsenate reductase family protein [Gracilibacillus alcaliphilus]MBM7675923.1 arsenate reductase [Gracilibacillus alcaliphilus]
MTLQFYWYPKCGTCRKAKQWLEAHDLDFEAIHIVEQPPSEEKLREVLEKSGLEPKKLFNTSGKKYRELGLKDKLQDMELDEMLKYLSADGMLIKRPLTIGDKQATVGFKEATFEDTWTK